MKVFYWVLGLVLLLVLSYYREVLFLSINEVLDHTSISKFNNIHPLIKDLEPSELIQIKYGLTVIFSILFVIVTLVFLRISLNEILASNIGAGIYGLIAIVSLIIIIVGISFWNFSTVYPLLRFIVEYIHSPFLYLILSTIPIIKDQLKKGKFD